MTGSGEGSAGGGGGNFTPSFADPPCNVRLDTAAGPADAPNAVWVVTIDRPRALNAIDVTTMRELAELFAACAEAAAGSPPLRAVIVTGAGDKAFVAGADIATLSAMAADEARAFSELGHLVGERIAALPVPVIAAVNGYALGGGCELALACDFIYASSAARFGLPEVRLGAIPGFGGTQRLLQRVGSARAFELLVTGEPIDAAEALRIGLCNQVVPPDQLLPQALRTAATIASRAPLAVASAKRVLRIGMESALAAGLRAEVSLFAELFTTADLAAGMRAFLAKAKQPPNWQGK